jgi:hypothetical protein
VSIFGARRDNHGNYSVLLDGMRKMTGNGFGGKDFNQSLFSVADLPYGKHDVVITNDESKLYLDLDYVIVTAGDVNIQ